VKSTTSNLCICSVQLLSHHSHIIILYMHHSLSQYCINILNEGRIGIAAQQVGIAKGCLDVALPYLNERKQFGTVIGNFQVRSILIERSAFVAYRLLHLPNQGTSPRLIPSSFYFISIFSPSGDATSVCANCDGNTCGGSDDLQRL